LVESSGCSPLQHRSVPQIEHLQPHIILQQDGAPPHCGLQVRECLDRTYPRRWIGRDGPMPWPPRSPDITPLDFFLWGYVKSNVFRTPVNRLDDLKSRIRIFQWTCSAEQGKSSNIIWTLSMLREPISRSTEISKKTSRVVL
jgi:hypothetical protein